MKRKGFTLVELLAVIVVLAIIALIAVPTVLGVIEKSKRSALQDSGYGLIEAANLYYVQYYPNKTVRFDLGTESDKLNYKGKVENGTVLLNNKGEVTVCINDGKYAAYKNYQDTKVTVVDSKTCTVPENKYVVYLDGESTITELTNQELTDEIETLKAEIAALKLEKASQTNVTDSMNDLTNKHDSDIINLSNSLSNLTNTHNSDINSINTRLNALTTNLANINKYYYSSGTVTSTVAPNTWTTVCSVSVPVGTYMVFGSIGVNDSYSETKFFGFWLSGGVQAANSGMHYYKNNSPYNYDTLSNIMGCSSESCVFNFKVFHDSPQNQNVNLCTMYAIKVG